MNNILKKLKKVSNNPYSFIADEEDNIYKVDKYYDTGCYILNAKLSGDMYGGIADGKRYMFAGPSSTAKSYFTAFILKGYLDQNPDSIAVIFETEGSSILDMIDSIGIDPSRVLIEPVKTIEGCRTKCMKMLRLLREGNELADENNKKTLTEIKKLKKKKKQDATAIKKLEDTLEQHQKAIFLIDSLGQLSTEKEAGDIEAGKDTKDMTRPGLLRGFGRASSLEFSLAKVPLLVVNHTYASMSQFDGVQIGGGEGPVYMADVVLALTKGKEKDETAKKNHVGAKIGVAIYKSRFGKENLFSHIVLHFEKGLYKYSDLVKKAEEYGVFIKKGNNYILPDGTDETMKKIRTNFKDYATKENMNAIAAAIKKRFKFGNKNES